MTIPVSNSPLKAQDMIELLREHYLPKNRPPAGIFAPEIGSPDGRRRLDALWQSVTRSGGLTLEGHEVKVSRSDLAVELQDLSKAESWMQYCDKWWLVVSDPSLIDGFDIPEAWGVMSPPSGRRKRSMTILKEAPLLKPISKEAGLLRLMTWQMNQRDEDKKTLFAENQSLESRVRNLEIALKNAQNGTTNTSWEQDIVDSVISKIRARGQDEKRWINFDENLKQDIADAIYDIDFARSTKQQIESRIDSLVRNMSFVDKAFNEVRKMSKELEDLRNNDK